jgi:threonine dehydrogenase-like Zn-dependent dehydrogenase
MLAAFLPGNSSVELRGVPDPEPGPRQVLVRMRASTICGSDLRAIYREHLGEGPEAYQGVVAGHEPCGEVVAVGPGCRERTVGDRVVVYHISGCGLCRDCRAGYRVGCTSPLRRAYGWQRDGGHADLLLAEEEDLVALPDALTFVDGACVACGFGTAYEALCRAGVSGRDVLLVTGLGPVGLAAAMLGRALGASRVIGTDPSPERRAFAGSLGVVDDVLVADADTVERVRELTGGHGAEVAVDCSGSGAGQRTAVRAARTWGRCVFVGEGGRLELDVSAEVIHRQLTLLGSWVTSTVRMVELLERLAAWELHSERVVTARLPLDAAGEAYARADGGEPGKVAIVW